VAEGDPASAQSQQSAQPIRELLSWYICVCKNDDRVSVQMMPTNNSVLFSSTADRAG